jgi:UDP-N-acetylglucosamine 2-epimerase
MRIATIVGARPQFVKASVVSRALRARHTEILIHTGQHYDANMSDVFFRDLDIPAPDRHLGIGSGSHGEQTGRMLGALEAALLEEKPDVALVYGDTNSTLAGALAAAKLGVPVAHVEAGCRSYDRSMPEEINRVVTDHVAALLFCPTPGTVENLTREGITRGVRHSGDVMLDLCRERLPEAERRSSVLTTLGIEAGRYLVATVHRAGNTDDRVRLTALVTAFGRLDACVVFPLHPRTRAALAGMPLPPNVHPVDPLGYLDMLVLVRRARMVLTDSGGVQKEAFFVGTPCLTLRDRTEWPETVEAGWNRIVDVDGDAIASAVATWTPSGPPVGHAFGDGRAAEKIVTLMAEAW